MSTPPPQDDYSHAHYTDPHDNGLVDYEQQQPLEQQQPHQLPHYTSSPHSPTNGLSHQQEQPAAQPPQQEILETRPIHSLFVAGLPTSITEDSFRSAFTHFTSLYQTSLARSKDGTIKPFGFVHFLSASDRSAALATDWSVTFGERVRVAIGESKNRVFVGNISKRVSEEQFANTVQNMTAPYSYESLVWKAGFAFIVYANFKLAEFAVRRLNRLDLEGKSLQVELAKSGSESLTGGTSIYVKGISPQASEDDVKQHFQNMTGGSLVSIRLVKPSQGHDTPFAFLEFADTVCASRALEMSGSEFMGSVMTCEVTRNSSMRQRRDGRDAVRSQRSRSRSRSRERYTNSTRRYSRSRSRSPRHHDRYRHDYYHPRHASSHRRSRSPPFRSSQHQQQAAAAYPPFYPPFPMMMGPDGKPMPAAAAFEKMPIPYPYIMGPGLPPFDSMPPAHYGHRSRSSSPRHRDRDYDRRRR